MRLEAPILSIAQLVLVHEAARFGLSVEVDDAQLVLLREQGIAAPVDLKSAAGRFSSRAPFQSDTHFPTSNSSR